MGNERSCSVCGRQVYWPANRTVNEQDWGILDPQYQECYCQACYSACWAVWAFSRDNQQPRKMRRQADTRRPIANTCSRLQASRCPIRHPAPQASMLVALRSTGEASRRVLSETSANLISRASLGKFMFGLEVRFSEASANLDFPDVQGIPSARPHCPQFGHSIQLVNRRRLGNTAPQRCALMPSCPVVGASSCPAGRDRRSRSRGGQQPRSDRNSFGRLAAIRDGGSPRTSPQPMSNRWRWLERSPNRSFRVPEPGAEGKARQ